MKEFIVVIERIVDNKRFKQTVLGLTCDIVIYDTWYKINQMKEDYYIVSVTEKN